MSFLNKAKIKKYCKEQRPGVRVSESFLTALHAKLKQELDFAISMPSNRKTMKDLIP